MTFDLHVEVSLTCDECGDEKLDFTYDTDQPADGLVDIEFHMESDGWRMVDEHVYCPACGVANE